MSIAIALSHLPTLKQRRVSLNHLCPRGQEETEQDFSKQGQRLNRNICNEVPQVSHFPFIASMYCLCSASVHEDPVLEEHSETYPLTWERCLQQGAVEMDPKLINVSENRPLQFTPILILRRESCERSVRQYYKNTSLLLPIVLYSQDFPKRLQSAVRCRRSCC